ncbi:hypothetical protein OVA24_17060 [Luteolibacter sp. SL250]|uniref:hypothetical protein n=1 Tax=Luteolibacter sp. SL250 TaxID=2995170 RepID=UPI00226FE9DB|nr:hypothetical protein [Luteolibacter sp. SL250]WAC18944.1 hypothetical protein OVA24_17060 [Luteolibacter sp. SL250]
MTETHGFTGTFHLRRDEALPIERTVGLLIIPPPDALPADFIDRQRAVFEISVAALKALAPEISPIVIGTDNISDLIPLGGHDLTAAAPDFEKDGWKVHRTSPGDQQQPQG